MQSSYFIASSTTSPLTPWLRAGRLLAAALLLLSTQIARAGGDDEDTWTIRCGAARGHDRSRIAKAYADALKKVRGLKDDKILVLDQEGETIVYYGRYVRKVVIDKNERGGLEAINMILAGFANFFLSAQQSRSASESGEKPATGSSSDTRAALN